MYLYVSSILHISSICIGSILYMLAGVSSELGTTDLQCNFLMEDLLQIVLDCCVLPMMYNGIFYTFEFNFLKKLIKVN